MWNYVVSHSQIRNPFIYRQHQHVSPLGIFTTTVTMKSESRKTRLNVFIYTVVGFKYLGCLGFFLLKVKP